MDSHFYVSEQLEWIYHPDRTAYLVDPKGYIYRASAMYDDTRIFRCTTKKNCGGTLVSYSGNFTPSTPHIYDCIPDESKVEVTRFFGYLKDLCAERGQKRTNNDIYEMGVRQFPIAGRLRTYRSMKRNIARWLAVDIQGMPLTMLELDELLQDPDIYERYGRSTFGNFERNDEPYRFYDGLSVVHYKDGNKHGVTYILAFINWSVVNAVKGKDINLAADGTHQIVPRLRVSHKGRFDNIREMYTVHVILHKKFYPLGFFLVQKTIVEVMLRIFEIVKEWLGNETAIVSVMTDYEMSARAAISKVWPGARKIGCTIHFIRALGLYAIKRGIYKSVKDAPSQKLMEKAYGLCYFPKHRMAAEVKQMESGIPRVGDAQKFGKKLIAYIREYWLPKNISVANEQVRCNNGSEIFHWNVIRNDNLFTRNPYQFLETLQNLNAKISNQICQWSHATQSARQQQVEKAHMRMVANLEPEIEAFGEDVAIENFFEATKHLTKKSSNFFEKIQHSSPKSHLFTETDMDFKSLWIQDVVRSKPATHTTKLTSQNRSMRILLVSVPNNYGREFFVTKHVTITTTNPTPIHGASQHMRSGPENLYFADVTVDSHHAELFLVEKNLFLRDLGSRHGTTINSRVVGYTGVNSSPQQIHDNDILEFGEVRMRLNILVTGTTELIPTINQHPNSLFIDVHIHLDPLHHDIPKRVVKVIETQTVILGRAKHYDPPTKSNALFKIPGLSYKHAKMYIVKDRLYIKPQSRNYPTNVNGQRIVSATFVQSGDEISLKTSQVTVMRIFYIPTTAMPNAILPTISLLQCNNVGLKFKMKTITFQPNSEIRIARRTIGQRDSTLNGIFDCSSISRQHATFRYATGQIILIDNGSTTGTYITSNTSTTRVLPNQFRVIKSGDIVQFGSSAGQNFIRAHFKVNLPQPHIRPLESNRHDSFNCYYPHCNSIFNTAKDLQRHIQRVHSPNDPSSIANKTKNFKCIIPNCDRFFIGYSYLENHIKREHPEFVRHAPSTSDGSFLPQYKCRVCDSIFVANEFLHEHMRREH